LNFIDNKIESKNDRINERVMNRLKTKDKEENYVLHQNNIIINNINTNNQYRDVNPVISTVFSEKMDIDSCNPTINEQRYKSENIEENNQVNVNKNQNNLYNRSKTNEPIGTDLNEFNEEDNQNTLMSIDSPEVINDFEIMNEIVEQQQKFNCVINKRIKNLKLLFKFWSDDITNALNGLGM